MHIYMSSDVTLGVRCVVARGLKALPEDAALVLGFGDLMASGFLSNDADTMFLALMVVDW